MDQRTKVQQWLQHLEPGVEIGAFKYPIPGIAPIYVDKFSEYANEACLADYFGEAVALPFRSNSMAFVASSHVLEHVANPIKALLEWARVLRHGGLIYMIVPDRRFTWDKNRALTPVDHMIDDYRRNISAVDATHIDDFVENVDWPSYSPQTPPECIAAEKTKLKQTYHHAVKYGNEINIHFHVFEPSNLAALVQAAGQFLPRGCSWNIVDRIERFPDENPNGVLLVIKLHKSGFDRLSGWVRRTMYRYDRNAALIKNAKKLRS